MIRIHNTNVDLATILNMYIKRITIIIIINARTGPYIFIQANHQNTIEKPEHIKKTKKQTKTKQKNISLTSIYH
jgi:hypothetical protein